MAVRVVVGDDSVLVREGLERMLASSPGIEVVASCASLDSLLAAIEEERPDLVVTDIRMPPSNTDEGIQLAALLRERQPEVGVVVLSQYAEPAYALKLLKSGSDRRGYLLKQRLYTRGELVSVIDEVARGGSFIDAKVVEVLVDSKTRAEQSPLTGLTPRERDVLAEVAKGKSNEAIADSLALTKRSVEKGLNVIFRKLGLAHADDVSKRVKASLFFLAERDYSRDDDQSPSAPDIR